MVKSRDMLILDCLRKDSRVSPLRISSQTDIPLDTVRRAIRRMERGVIKKYVSFMDFSSLGYKKHVNIYVSSQEPENLVEFIAGHKSVNSVFKLKGDYDLMVDAFFLNDDSLDEFMAYMKKNGAKDVVCHEVLDEILHEAMSLDDDERIDYPKHLFLLLSLLFFR